MPLPFPPRSAPIGWVSTRNNCSQWQDKKDVPTTGIDGNFQQPLFLRKLTHSVYQCLSAFLREGMIRRNKLFIHLVLCIHKFGSSEYCIPFCHIVCFCHVTISIKPLRIVSYNCLRHLFNYRPVFYNIF